MIRYAYILEMIRMGATVDTVDALIARADLTSLETSSLRDELADRESGFA